MTNAKVILGWQCNCRSCCQPPAQAIEGSFVWQKPFLLPYIKNYTAQVTITKHAANELVAGGATHQVSTTPTHHGSIQILHCGVIINCDLHWTLPNAHRFIAITMQLPLFKIFLYATLKTYTLRSIPVNTIGSCWANVTVTVGKLL